MGTVTQQQTVRQVIASGLFSIADDAHFSWRGCDTCTEDLGATVYDGQGRMTPRGEVYEFQICADCVNRLYYGEK